jgi:hypothetical protein
MKVAGKRVTENRQIPGQPILLHPLSIHEYFLL